MKAHIGDVVSFEDQYKAKRYAPIVKTKQFIRNGISYIGYIVMDNGFERCVDYEVRQ